jgi:hypothetical protein
MAKSRTDIMRTVKKRPGQAGEFIGVRVQPPLLSKIEEWRSNQRPIPSAPEAIRRLVEQALERKERSK